MDILSHTTGVPKLAAAGLLLLVLWVQAPAAQSQAVSELEVKAAMLYHFTKFVEWPAGTWSDASAPLTICVSGRDPFGAILDQEVAGRTVHGRPIRVARPGRAEDLKGCHILFISTPEGKRFAEAILTPPRPGVLTVSDLEAFIHDGGMIGFVTRDDKVRFEVNLEAAGRGQLKISARLLKLAIEVRQSPGGGD